MKILLTYIVVITLVTLSVAFLTDIFIAFGVYFLASTYGLKFLEVK